MILTPVASRQPVHVTPRRNGGVRLSACGRDLYLSSDEASALFTFLASHVTDSDQSA